MTVPIAKLSSEQERRIIRGIEKVIGLTRSGDMKVDEAFVKVARELQFSPEITRRACEAFNKSKTVHMLSKLASAQRANDFELANPDAVVDSLFAPTRARMEVPVIQMHVDDGLGKCAMNKVAAVQLPATREEAKGMLNAQDNLDRAAKELEDPEATTLEELMGRAPLYAEDDPAEGADTNREVVQRQKEQLSKKARMEEVKDFKRRAELLDRLYWAKSEMGQRKVAFERAVRDGLEEMGKLSPEARRNCAQAMVNGMGDKGIAFVKMAAASLGESLPVERTSNFAIIPANPATRAFSKAAEEAEAHGQLMHRFQKMAQLASSLANLARPLIPAAGQIAGGIGGALGGGAATTAEQAVRLIEATAPGMPTADFVTNAVLDPRFTNMMDTLNNQQAFVTVATDPVMSKYPLEQVRQAYNNTVSVMPQLERESNRPFLLSMVRRQLAQNRMYDPAEMAQVSQTMQAMERSTGERERQFQDMQRRLFQEGRNYEPFDVQGLVGGITAPVAQAWTAATSAPERLATPVLNLPDQLAADRGRRFQQPPGIGREVLTGFESVEQARNKLAVAFANGTLPSPADVAEERRLASQLGLPRDYANVVGEALNVARSTEFQTRQEEERRERERQQAAIDRRHREMAADYSRNQGRQFETNAMARRARLTGFESIDQATNRLAESFRRGALPIPGTAAEQEEMARNLGLPPTYLPAVVDAAARANPPPVPPPVP